jgi:hypothetical protein
MKEVEAATTRASDQRARWAILASLGLGFIIALCLAIQTWRQLVPDLALGSKGTLHAVMLNDGQIYYGNLEAVTANALVLTQVFYVQTSLDEQTKQRVNKLVSRTREDWHGPLKTTIPLDKILMVEVVGPNSTVAKLIHDANAQAK